MRLAALFHLFSGETRDISVEHIEQAITLMTWYLSEARCMLEPSINPAQYGERPQTAWLARAATTTNQNAPRHFAIGSLA